MKSTLFHFCNFGAYVTNAVSAESTESIVMAAFTMAASWLFWHANQERG